MGAQQPLKQGVARAEALWLVALICFQPGLLTAEGCWRFGVAQEVPRILQSPGIVQAAQVHPIEAIEGGLTLERAVHCQARRCLRANVPEMFRNTVHMKILGKCLQVYPQQLTPWCHCREDVRKVVQLSRLAVNMGRGFRTMVKTNSKWFA